MLAVVETGGKQYLIAPGQKLKIEKIKGVQVGDEIIFDKVLLFADEKGEIQIGQPYIVGMKISAKCEEEGRSKKVIVFRYKSKTRYTKKKGHRQPFMKVSIKDLKGKDLKEKEEKDLKKKNLKEKDLKEKKDA